MDTGQPSVAGCLTKVDRETYDSFAALSSCSSTTFSSAAMFPLNLACSWFLFSILRLSLCVRQKVNMLPLYHIVTSPRRKQKGYGRILDPGAGIFDLSKQSTYRLLHFSRECNWINVLLVLNWCDGWPCGPFGRHDQSNEEVRTPRKGLQRLNK